MKTTLCAKAACLACALLIGGTIALPSAKATVLAPGGSVVSAAAKPQSLGGAPYARSTVLPAQEMNIDYGFEEGGVLHLKPTQVQVARLTEQKGTFTFDVSMYPDVKGVLLSLNTAWLPAERDYQFVVITAAGRAAIDQTLVHALTPGAFDLLVRGPDLIVDVLRAGKSIPFRAASVLIGVPYKQRPGENTQLLRLYDKSTGTLINGSYYAGGFVQGGVIASGTFGVMSAEPSQEDALFLATFTQNDVFLRAEPSMAAEVIGVAREGERPSIIGFAQGGAWARVMWNGKECAVQTEYLRFTFPSQPSGTLLPLGVAASDAAATSKPGAGDTLARLKAGDKVILAGRAGAFWVIRLEDQTAYVAGDALTYQR